MSIHKVSPLQCSFVNLPAENLTAQRLPIALHPLSVVLTVILPFLCGLLHLS